MGYVLEIKSDLYRYGKNISLYSFLITYKNFRLFRFTVWFRIAKHYQTKKISILKLLSRWYYHHLCIKYGIDLPLSVSIGLGFKINHGMGLVINSKSVIGNNVMLSHNVTLASEKGGAPSIGDRVRISPGAVIVGKVRIGNDSVIGANCVVVKDVPDNSVAVGVPNRNLERRYEETVDRYYYK